MDLSLFFVAFDPPGKPRLWQPTVRTTICQRKMSRCPLATMYRSAVTCALISWAVLHTSAAMLFVIWSRCVVYKGEAGDRVGVASFAGVSLWAELFRGWA